MNFYNNFENELPTYPKFLVLLLISIFVSFGLVLFSWSSLNEEYSKNSSEISEESTEKSSEETSDESSDETSDYVIITQRTHKVKVPTYKCKDLCLFKNHDITPKENTKIKTIVENKVEELFYDEVNNYQKVFDMISKINFNKN